MTERSEAAGGAPAHSNRRRPPFLQFVSSASAGGLVLVIAAVLALICANSPLASAYQELFQTHVAIGLGDYVLDAPLLFWINDGLMALFFLLVGLEIKRELAAGELASRDRAILPVVAALGGALGPALIFLLAVSGPDGRGWGIPMATDIAFALGVLTVLGSRVPIGLKVFLTAFAIADDLIAVLVIALFYSSGLSVAWLAGAGFVFAILLVLGRAGVRHPLIFAALGIPLWLAVLESGVHPAIAGVLLAFAIPVRPADDGSEPPAIRIERSLEPWVAFVIVPLFAFANAGVALVADAAAFVSDPITLGIAAGLLVGKQLGITISTRVLVTRGLARLPSGVTWTHVYGVSWLGGIGFTMSLFVAELAYAGAPGLQVAKLAILATSIVAGVGGFLILRSATSTPGREEPAP